MIDLHDKRAHYPRVSDIIGKQNGDELRNVPLDVLANACLRGQRVHDYCTAWVRNLWVSDIEPEYELYLDAFKQWADDKVDDCKHSNVRLYDDVKRFTGEYDLIVKLRTGQHALIDIKTTCVKSKTWPVQLSAYAHLCRVNDYPFDEVYNVHLKKVKPAVYEEIQGEKVQVSPPVIKAIETKYDADQLSKYWEIFSSALECYDYFTRKEVA